VYLYSVLWCNTVYLYSVKIELLFIFMIGSTSIMISNKKDAIDTLTYNNIKPEILINHLRIQPDRIVTYKDCSNTIWSYTTRGRTRLYLMAKMPFMTKYEEIYWIPNH